MLGLEVLDLSTERGYLDCGGTSGMRILVAALAACGYAGRPVAAEPAPAAGITWDSVIRVSQTTPSLQVVVNPPCDTGLRSTIASFSPCTTCIEVDVLKPRRD